ncbi:MAG TPA: C45 family peptidase [Chloroflexota bacterium]|nr:C45 family peptidase [Chloroflexota bacterium]
MQAGKRPLPLLDLVGSSRAIGRAHGETAREQIAHNVGLYFRRFAVEGGVHRAEALDRGAQYLAVIDRSAPDYGDIVRGIAEGSGRHLLEIAALNARYEIMYSEFSRVVMETSPRVNGADGCTAFAVMPEASADGHLRIGQNWDWIEGVEGLLLRVRREDGLHILSFTEAGIAGGKIGFNSAGIGLVINGLVSDQDSWERLRTPFHVRTWRILNSRSLAEAIGVVKNEERSCSANYLLAHLSDDGRAHVIDVETAPMTTRELEPDSGVLAHANHFLEPDQLSVWQPLEECTTTFRRCARMQVLLAKQCGRLDDATLQNILADHDGDPLGICTHSSTLFAEDESYVTVFSTVIDLHAGRMLVAAGNPCVTRFESVTFEEPPIRSR